MQQRDLGISLGELMEACQQLASKGLVEIKRGMFVHPTNAGEQLIRAVTGKEAKQTKIPVLPSPPG